MSSNTQGPALTRSNQPWPQRYQQLARKTRSPLIRSFYEAGCIDPDTPMSEVPMLAMDFETTGLDPVRNSIVSVGMVPFTLDGIRLGECRHWVVRPRLPLNQTSITIHNITHSDIDKAPELEDILGEMFELLKGRIPVVHYRNIERQFLDRALKARLNEGFTFPVLDTMAIEAFLHPDRRPSGWQRLLGKKPVSIRLADSRRRYGLPHYASHNALIDAIATAELLQAQIQYHFSPQTPVRDLWL